MTWAAGFTITGLQLIGEVVADKDDPGAACGGGSVDLLLLGKAGENRIEAACREAGERSPDPHLWREVGDGRHAAGAQPSRQDDAEDDGESDDFVAGDRAEALVQLLGALAQAGDRGPLRLVVDHEVGPQHEGHGPADREHVPGEFEEGDVEPGDLLLEPQRDGALDPAAVARSVGARMPEGAIVVDMGVSRLEVDKRTGRGAYHSGGRLVSKLPVSRLTATNGAVMLGKVEEVEVEEDSPLRAVITVRGHHVNDAGEPYFGFLLRYYCHADDPLVRVDHVLQHDIVEPDETAGRELG